MITSSKATTQSESEVNKMRNINEVMKELAEMNALLEETNAIIEGLKDEVKEYMNDQGVDEVVSDSGKATWREVISSRFASTEFKKVHADLYKAFCRSTTSRRFTFNA